MPTAMIEHAELENRVVAGKALAARLRERHYERSVVLALPRGGVPVAMQIAMELDSPLDLILVRKLGIPGQEELALGAVTDGEQPNVVINETVRHAAGITDEQIERIRVREILEIERRRKLYLGNRQPVSLEGVTAIVVDDGIATGATMRVALEAIRSRGAARLVVATGVATPDVVGHLSSEVEEVIALIQPEPLHSIGSHYEDFRQVSDSEVTELLNKMSRG